jgi:hypothetical protein
VGAGLLVLKGGPTPGLPLVRCLPLADRDCLTGSAAAYFPPGGLLRLITVHNSPPSTPPPVKYGSVVAGMSGDAGVGEAPVVTPAWSSNKLCLSAATWVLACATFLLKTFLFLSRFFLSLVVNSMHWSTSFSTRLCFSSPVAMNKESLATLLR